MQQWILVNTAIIPPPNVTEKGESITQNIPLPASSLCPGIGSNNRWQLQRESLSALVRFSVCEFLLWVHGYVISRRTWLRGETLAGLWGMNKLGTKASEPQGLFSSTGHLLTLGGSIILELNRKTEQHALKERLQGDVSKQLSEKFPPGWPEQQVRKLPLSCLQQQTLGIQSPELEKQSRALGLCACNCLIPRITRSPSITRGHSWA